MAEQAKQRFDEFVEYVKDGVEKQDPTILGVLVAVVVVFITIVLFCALSRKSNTRRGVLLLGNCDSGKTLLFTRLVHRTEDDLITVTSISINSGNYYVKNKNKYLRILDLPGHERLRTQMLEHNKRLARGIIFVVDSGTLLKEVKEVAEYLYTVLSDNVISRNFPPVLVACNKSDLTLAKGKDIIKKNLASEMNKQRVTRSAALQQLEGVANNNTFLGKRDRDFAFEDLKPLKIEFVECSAVTGKIDLNEVENWLNKIA